MTRDRAAALLGCAADAAPIEVRRRFEALFNEHQIRLTNAPTPALRRTYQKSLQELKEASDLLAPGLAGDAADLPATTPAYVSDDPAAGGSVPPEPPGPREEDGNPSGSLPTSTLIAGAAAAVFLAALTASGLLWVREHRQRVDVETAATAMQARLRDAEAAVQGFDTLFFADRLRVRNASRQPLRIVAAAVVYQGSDGRPQLAHSGSYGYPTWELRPDQIVQIDSGVGRGRDWDGRVLSYALLLEYPDSDPFLQTGLWAADQDRLDKVVPLALD